MIHHPCQCHSLPQDQYFLIVEEDIMRFICLLIYLFSFLSVCSLSAWESTNLLRGDSDVEIEYLSATDGPWGNSSPSSPRWKQDKSTGFQSSSSICVHTFAGIGMRNIHLNPGEYIFSFWAKGTSESSVGYIMVNREKDSWDSVLDRRKISAVMMTPDWKRYVFPFKVDESGLFSPYFGADNETVWFDRFMLNAGNTPLPWEQGEQFVFALQLPDTPGNVFPFDNEIEIIAQVLHSQKTALKKSLEIYITDCFGENYFSFGKGVAFDDFGIFQKIIKFSPGISGWFRISMNFSGEPEACWNSFVLARPPEPDIPGLEPFVGLCGAETFIDSAKRIGIKYLQPKLSWDACESREGECRFDFERWREYKEKGFKLHALVPTAAPKWALDPIELKESEILGLASHRLLPSEELLETSWRAFIRTFLKKHKGLFDYWEIGGELDALIGLNTYYKAKEPQSVRAPFVLGNSIERAAKQIDIAIEEIRAAEPSAYLSAVRPSDVDSRYAYSYSKEVFKRLKGRLDFFGIDCYPQPRWIGPDQPPTGTEQDLAQRHDDALAAMKNYFDSSDVRISEYGYFIDHEQVSNLKWLNIHASKLARSYIKARELGFKSLHYYSTNIPNREGKYFHMGIWFQGNPLVAVAALNAVGLVVENVVKTKSLPVNENINAAVFEKNDGRAVAALWNIKDDSTLDIVIPDEDFECSNFMGNPFLPEKKNGKLNLKVDGRPVYIWRKAADSDNFVFLTKGMEMLQLINKPPVDAIFLPTGHNNTRLWLRNRSQTQSIRCILETSATSALHKIILDIPAGKTISQLFTLEKNTTTLEFFIKFAANYAPMHLQYSPPEILSIPQITADNLGEALPPTDGSRATISLSGSDHIHPVDHTSYNGSDDLSADLFLAHDETYFYVSAEVTDDKHFNNSGQKGLWYGDCLQIAIAKMEYPVEKGKLGQNGCLISAALLSGTPVIMVHHTPQNSVLEKTIEYQISRNDMARRTLYKMRIPLALLGSGFENGKTFRFNCVVFDDDSGGGADYWMFLRQGLAGSLNPELFIPCLLD